MTTASDLTRRTPRGHLHVEAFCLMHYECRECLHHEVIWNSRDGVTPFGTSCPSCGKPSLCHAHFGSDKYAPDHKPHKGQRVWITMSRERALAFARRNVLHHKKPGPQTDELIEQVAESYYMNGQAPDLRIEGYTDDFGTGDSQ